MQRILIMAARILGPILLTKFLRGRKKKRHLPEEQQVNPHVQNQTNETIEH